MGEPPSDEHSVERNDNDAGYSAFNCRWATIFEQAMNRRNSTNVVLHGEIMPVTRADVGLGHRQGFIRRRALAKGVSQQQIVDELLLNGVPPRRRSHNYNLEEIKDAA
jgi:hypothetical protein